MKMKTLFVPALILMSAVACNQNEIIKSVNSGSLIGGQPANEDEYRSTIKIKGNCTASKIGSKTFITAAHCMVDSNYGSLRSKFEQNKKLKIITHYGISQIVTINQSYPHETYVSEAKRRAFEGLNGVAIALAAFDIGVFSILEETERIPVAKIGLDRVHEDEKVIIGGWGCDENINKLYDYSKAQYKIAKSTVVSGDLAIEDYYSRDFSRVSDFNFLTQGLKLDNTTASICPGDSGGPVYREHDGVLLGVNSQYLFNDESGVSYVNTHTRISEVSEWLREHLD